jgi:hypothetical protein
MRVPVPGLDPGIDPRIQDGARAANHNRPHLGARIKSGRDGSLTGRDHSRPASGGALSASCASPDLIRGRA